MHHVRRPQIVDVAPSPLQQRNVLFAQLRTADRILTHGVFPLARWRALVKLISEGLIPSPTTKKCRAGLTGFLFEAPLRMGSRGGAGAAQPGGEAVLAKFRAILADVQAGK